MAQITAYLTAENDAAFRDYAASLGLDASSLATLLLTRELRVGRLRRLASKSSSVRGPAHGKITAHAPSEAMKARWIAHAQGCGLSASRAAALVFTAEPVERWLERAVNHFDSE